MQQLASPSKSELSHLSHLEDLELVERHKQGDQSATDRLIRKHLPWIRASAKHVQSKSNVDYVNCLDFDDFVQEGSIAFVKCLERFEPRTNHRLRTFACLRVVGAMRDALRSLDFVSRTDRKSGKATAEILRSEWDTGNRLTVKFTEPVSPPITQPIDEDQWQKILRPFSQRERQALQMYYRQGRTLISIADQMGVSESFIQRMIADCVKFIRQRRKTMGLDVDEFF